MNLNTRDRLSELHARMRVIGARDMDNLSYAEAALFHLATDAVERIIDSIDEMEGSK